MKVMIGVDIEGVTGLASLDESRGIDREWYGKFCVQMRDEAAAAARGAVKAGADEVYVVDIHGGNGNRNMPLDGFPGEVKIVRGRVLDGQSCISCLDESFDAIMLVGYHDMAGSDRNPTSHSINRRDIAWIKLNGELIGEVGIVFHQAAALGVPMVMVSGDEECCKRSSTYRSGIRTSVTKTGYGYGIVSRTPEVVVAEIEKVAEEAVRNRGEIGVGPVADSYVTEVRWHDHHLAKRAANYPGAEKLDTHTVRFRGGSIEDISRFYFWTV